MVEVIKYLLLAVEVLVAVLLIGIILLQRSKEQGLGLAFGSGMGEALFGAEAGNVLTKATVILAIVFMVNTIALAKVFTARQGYGSVMSDVASEPAVPQTPAGGSLPPNIPVPPAPDGAEPVDAGSVPATPVTVPDSSAVVPMEGSTPAMPAVPATPAEVPAMPAVPATPEVPAPAE